MNIRLIACFSLLCLPPATQAQQQIEGKLFSTPEQREYLDFKRKEYLEKNKRATFDIQDSQVPDIPGNAPAAAAEPVIYTLGGILKRSDGRLSIWLNNRQLSEEQLPSGVRVVRDGAVLMLQVKLDSGKNQLLRTGQTIDLSTGTLQERSHRPAPPKESAPAKQDSKPDADSPAAKAPEAKPAATPAAAIPATTPAAAATANQPAQSPADSSLVSKQAIDVLLGDMSKDPQALDTMIKSLQAVRDSQNAPKNP